MTKFYRTKEFQKLQNTWYGKLKKEGFGDVETIDPKTGDAYPVMTTHAGCYNSSLDAVRKYGPDKQRYYELARAHYWGMQGSDDECLAFYMYAHLGASVSLVSKALGRTRKWVRTVLDEQEALFLPKKRPTLRLVE